MYTIIHIYNLQVQFLIENNLYGAEKIKLRQGPYPTSNLWHSQMAPNTLAQSFQKRVKGLLELITSSSEYINKSTNIET